MKPARLDKIREIIKEEVQETGFCLDHLQVDWVVFGSHDMDSRKRKHAQIKEIQIIETITELIPVYEG